MPRSSPFALRSTVSTFAGLPDWEITMTAAVLPGQSPDTGRGHGSGNKLRGSFHPCHITVETFRVLLSHYPLTVERAFSHKIKLKLQSKSKPAKGSKRKKETKVSVAPITKTELDPAEEKHIREETDRFLQLDQWRYATLPGIIAKRKDKGVSNGNEVEGAYLLKEELIDIMEWKLKHGVSRPMLMGMIKSNQVATITKSTSTAFAALPHANPILAPDDAFPKASLDALTAPLRGVGPATASLILSVATVLGDAEQQVPFYSDDVYLWLCLLDFPQTERPEVGPLTGNSEGCTEQKNSKHKKPNGELIAKYNMNEYRDLWNASQELRARLNKDIEDGSEAELISLIDIERVAYVLRNLAFSNYHSDQYSEETLQSVGSVSSGPSEELESESGELGKRRSKRLKK